MGSLCSGYGGLDLALDAQVAWHAETAPAAVRVLDAHWPGVPNHGDITSMDWSRVEPVDWLTAGYPCQPWSLAGKRKGADDVRHLWPHIARAIGVLRPRRVLLENVAAHLRLGFHSVLADLAGLGYDARWGVVRASDTGAPHARARLFVVAADTDGQRGERCRACGRGWSEPAHRGDPAPGPGAEREPGEPTDWGAYEPAIRRWAAVTGRAAPGPTEPGRNGPRLSPAFTEWMMGLPAGWVTAVPGVSRSGQLAVLGNGVVPQQAALAVELLTAGR